MNYQEIDEDFPLGTQEDNQEDDHEVKEAGRSAKLDTDHHPSVAPQVQKKPSLQKEEDDYEDDFHDDEFEDEEEIESSADKKATPAPPDKSPEV